MKGIKRANLTNLKPCNQNWDNMTMVPGGRLCQKCSKTIVDFRAMTDQEIAETHAFTTGSVCGLYQPSQLKLPSGPMRSKKRTWWALLVAGYGILFSKEAQAKEVSPAKSYVLLVEQRGLNRSAIQPADSLPQTPQDSIFIFGKISDENSEPIPFATIHVKGTKFGTTSDVHGNYQLNVSSLIDSSQIFTLVYSYVGYGQEEVVFHKKDLANPARTKMDVQFTNQQAIVYYVIYKLPLHKRIWRKLKSWF